MKSMKSVLGIIVLLFLAAVVYVAGHSGLFNSENIPLQEQVEPLEESEILP